jgi:hypothetical protein
MFRLGVCPGNASGAAQMHVSVSLGHGSECDMSFVFAFTFMTRAASFRGATCLS